MYRISSAHSFFASAKAHRELFPSFTQLAVNLWEQTLVRLVYSTQDIGLGNSSKVYHILIYMYIIFVYHVIYTYWIQNPKFCGLKTNYRVFLRNSKKTWLFLKNLVISHILVLWWFMMIYDSFSIFQQHHVWFHWGFVVLYEVDSASICAPSDERKHLINGNQNHKQILFDMTPR